MLRIVYGLKLDCEVALRTRRIGWRDTTNNGGSELTAKLQRSNHQVRPGHDDIKIKMFDTTSGHEALGSQGPFTVLAKAYFLTWGERQTTRGTAEAEKIREEVDMIDYNEKLVYEEKIKEDSKLSGNPPYLEGGGRSVAVLYAPSGTTTTASCSMRAAVLGGKQQQHHSLPSVGARPCSRAGAPRVSSRSSRGTATTPTRTCGTASRSRRSRRSTTRPGNSAIHDQNTGQVHQVVSDLHIVSFCLYIDCTVL